MYVATGDILLHIPVLHPPQIGRLCPFDVYIWIFEINAPIITKPEQSKQKLQTAIQQQSRSSIHSPAARLNLKTHGYLQDICNVSSVLPHDV